MARPDLGPFFCIEYVGHRNFPQVMLLIDFSDDRRIKPATTHHGPYPRRRSFARKDPLAFISWARTRCGSRREAAVRRARHAVVRR